MPTLITTIQSTDLITNSRTDINNNFSSLNTNKIETSVIDTDTALAANSDAKLPSQKAVKAYVDTLGNVNASTSVRGIVEEATVAEIGAGTAAGGTGARLFMNPSSTVSTSAGAGDVGKIPRLGATGKLDTTFVTFPSITSGQTTHDISSTAAQTIAHGLSTTPRFVKVTFMYTGGTAIAIAIGTYAGGQSAVSGAVGNGTKTDLRSGNNLLLDSDIVSPITATAAIGAPDATNINLTWGKNGSPTGTVYILWEAYA